MQRREFMSGLMVVGGAGWLAPASAAVNESDAAIGIRAALEKGAGVAVDLLGRNGGFMDNPKLRIPLPGFLNDGAKILRLTGQQKRVDDLVAAMNHAAELAVPEARSLLLNAVRSMSVDDGLKILRGGDTAATQFFSAKTRAPIGARFLPIVTEATKKVDLADKYNAVAGKAAGLGLVRKEDANVQQYVTGKALDGLFSVIGDEEKKIRADPVGTGSALLSRVFSAYK